MSDKFTKLSEFFGLCFIGAFVFWATKANAAEISKNQERHMQNAKNNHTIINNYYINDSKQMEEIMQKIKQSETNKILEITSKSAATHQTSAEHLAQETTLQKPYIEDDIDNTKETETNQSKVTSATAKGNARHLSNASANIATTPANANKNHQGEEALNIINSISNLESTTTNPSAPELQPETYGSTDEIVKTNEETTPRDIKKLATYLTNEGKVSEQEVPEQLQIIYNKNVKENAVTITMQEFQLTNGSQEAQFVPHYQPAEIRNNEYTTTTLRANEIKK